ncbi:MAG TPA: c-type cytochrome [Bdellovibrionota bacterium]|jgi:cytochrome c2|nr:c-type cytochrome [Bdellovibrionota bacterium]
MTTANADDAPTTGLPPAGKDGAIDLSAPDPDAGRLELKQSGKSLAKLTLSDIRGKLEPTAQVVKDPFEDEEAAYLTFRFNIILTIFYGNGWQDWDELLFTRTDGEQVLVPIERFKKHTAHLAFGEPDGREFFLYDKLDQKGRRVDLGPWYLIWENLQDLDMADEGPEGWVWKIKTVEIIRFPERFPNSAPAKDASKQVRDGFIMFRKHCMRCHSINGEGGGDPPVELNYPVSITEYFKFDMMDKWIMDPKSVRYNTKMEGIGKNVRDRDLITDDIVAYLQAMSGNKKDPENAAKGFTGTVPRTVPAYVSEDKPVDKRNVGLAKKIGSKKKKKHGRSRKKKR